MVVGNLSRRPTIPQGQVPENNTIPETKMPHRPGKEPMSPLEADEQGYTEGDDQGYYPDDY